MLLDCGFMQGTGALLNLIILCNGAAIDCSHGWEMSIYN